ncbi:hypothetical protein C1E23_11630, partial [Pseudoalteromonas phenolica]
NSMYHYTGDGRLNKDKYSFFYPDLVMSRTFGEQSSQPATIEALTSPWIIVKYIHAEDGNECYIVYYNKQGSTVDEFIYFIDALSHYQLLLTEKPIEVRFTNSCPEAPNNLYKAKIEYMNMWGSDESREKRLNRVTCERIPRVLANYCPMEVGMREDD